MARLDLYLMSPPHPEWALRARTNFRSREAAQVDARAARREWLALAQQIEARGGTVIALEPDDAALTGMPYAAECGQVVERAGRPPLFLLPRMAHEHRRPEARRWEALARKLGMEPLDVGRGIWEAQGDVAHFGGATLLFYGGRTDEAGMRAAAEHFSGEQLHLEIREPAFHGNMAALPLPAVDRMLVCPEVIAPHSLQALTARFGEERLILVREEELRRYATNGLPVGRDLLAPSVVPERVQHAVREAGMNVVPLRMAELCEKGGGASRCLVSYAQVEEGTVQLPDEHRLSAIARRIEEAA